MKKKYIITFAGVVGSSKTPIATFLSGRLGLPIHNNDVIRTEVIEDHGSLVEKEYLARRDTRLQWLFEQGEAFILDASVDREWKQVKDACREHDYSWFLISLDLSESLLARLHEWKGYTESKARLTSLVEDHEQFLKTFTEDVSLHLSDVDFPDRLRKSEQTIRQWLERAS